MYLKFKGISGPNGERENEIRHYPEEEAGVLLTVWPTHFVKPHPDEVPTVEVDETPIEEKPKKSKK